MPSEFRKRIALAVTQRVMLCGLCGNITAFEVEGGYPGKVRYYFNVSKVTEIDDIPHVLLRCLTCSYPTLMLDDLDYAVLYPISKKNLTNLPKTIEKEYEATLKVRNISANACAVLARRTLEAILTHEQAKGKTLELKVNDLLNLERIPPLLGSLAHLGRQIGNLGVHFDKKAVSKTPQRVEKVLHKAHQ
jgi:hypothetical protein